MCSFVFAQVTRIRAGKLAEAAFVRLLTIVQGADMGLQLRVRSRRVSAAITDIGSFACVRPLVIIFSLVRGKRLVAAFVAAGIRAVASMAEEVARKLRALLEIFG